MAEQPTGGFVLGLGPLVKSNEFYLAVNSREIRDKLILCGNIVVKERNFKIRSTDATRFTARIYWTPPFVPSGAIAEALGTECNVETIVYEMYKYIVYEMYKYILYMKCVRRKGSRQCNRRTPGNSGRRPKEIASFGHYH